jgi:hypothetical protein
LPNNNESVIDMDLSLDTRTVKIPTYSIERK